MRVKGQETCLTLQEHDDDDDDENKHTYVLSLLGQLRAYVDRVINPRTKNAENFFIPLWK